MTQGTPHASDPRRDLTKDEQNALHRALMASTTPASDPRLDEWEALASSFPEINPSNFAHDDACHLNDWGCQAAEAILALIGMVRERDGQINELRTAIFGSADHDPSLRHYAFLEMAKATDDARQGAIDRATAAEAIVARLTEAGEEAHKTYLEVSAERDRLRTRVTQLEIIIDQLKAKFGMGKRNDQDG